MGHSLTLLKRRRGEKTKRVTVAVPLRLYGEFQQFAFYRVWSNSRAALWLIEHGLKAEKVREAGKRG